jgi:hypothetical protein
MCPFSLKRTVQRSVKVSSLKKQGEVASKWRLHSTFHDCRAEISRNDWMPARGARQQR